MGISPIEEVSIIMNTGIKEQFRSIKKSLYRLYEESPLIRILHPRRFHAYAIGSAKTGTHSLWTLFQNSYRAAHEIGSDEMIDWILKKERGEVTATQVTEWIRKRDQKLWLEMDSSQLNFYFLADYISEFPEAKFILTIRDCYTWLNSLLNEQLPSPTKQVGKWSDLKAFDQDTCPFDYGSEEITLKEKGFHPLEFYFADWARRIQKTREIVPPEKLLILRTDQLSYKIPEIAEFLRIPLEGLSQERSHAYKRLQKEDFVSGIDRSYFQRKADQYCTLLMQEFFPEIRSADDVLDR
jgi:hypothetical protein